MHFVAKIEGTEVEPSEQRAESAGDSKVRIAQHSGRPKIAPVLLLKRQHDDTFSQKSHPVRFIATCRYAERSREEAVVEVRICS